MLYYCIYFNLKLVKLYMLFIDSIYYITDSTCSILDSTCYIFDNTCYILNSTCHIVCLHNLILSSTFFCLEAVSDDSDGKDSTGEETDKAEGESIVSETRPQKQVLDYES